MNIKFNTRIKKGGDKHITNAVINWDNVSDDVMKKLATKSIIIMAQSAYRDIGKVPATDTINVSNMMTRVRVVRAAQSPVEMMSALLDADYIAALINLGADEHTAMKMAAKRTAKI